jgi:hypothetical protein
VLARVRRTIGVRIEAAPHLHAPFTPTAAIGCIRPAIAARRPRVRHIHGRLFMHTRLVLFTTLLLASASALAQTIVGLNDGNALVRFPAAAPGTVLATTPVTGLQAGDTLLGIDVRPATGQLYGLATGGRLYTIDPATGVATLASTLNVALSGTVFATDFNPVPDRLRVISDSGQNLRINVTTGETLVDGAINPAGSFIAGAAYINSVGGAATTALYDIDVVASRLLLQNPPNDGTVTPVGPLGVALDAGGSVGFDVRTVGATNTAYAVLRVAGTTGLYTVNLATGAATLVGPVGGNPSLRGMAVLAGAVVPPAPASATAVGLAAGNTLVRFAASSPGTIQGTVPVTGLQAGDALVGIDFRPATGVLYGLASAGRLYTINPGTGVAVLTSTLGIAPTGTVFGVDFNPVPDRLRVVSNSGQNLRINVDTGETINDGAINPAGPQLAGAAYTNAVAGATSTALFDIDAASSTLFLQNPPNDGTLVAIGPLGVAATASTGFDILTSAGNNTPFAALSVGGSTGLYTIDLASGAATLVGPIGGNPNLLGLALSPTAIAGGPGPGGPPAVRNVPVDAPVALLLLALAMVLLAATSVRRIG